MTNTDNREDQFSNRLSHFNIYHHEVILITASNRDWAGTTFGYALAIFSMIRIKTDDTFPEKR